MKNQCNRMRDRKRPYEVWQAGNWTWNVLKKYQSPENEAKNPCARWMCFVTSPFAPYGDMGDVYVREIANQGAVLVKHDYD